jgi:hypothetical protein
MASKAAGNLTQPGASQRMGFAARARYRLRQFRRGLLATLRPAISATEMEKVRHLLPAGAFSLFAALPPDAQRHSLNVLQTLAEAGPVEDDLAAAALLHDVGKLEARRAGAPIGLWLRGPLVLAEATLADRLANAARNNAQAGWRYTVWVHLHHAAIGAEWAAHAGCSPRSVWLILHHGDAPASGSVTTSPPARHAPHPSPETGWLDDLRLLQWADNQN